MNGWRDRQARGRTDSMPVELPPPLDPDARRRAVDREPRLVAPPVPRTPLPRLVARIAVGSVGIALAAGVVVGRMTAVETASAAPGRGPAQVQIRGAGHLNGAPGAEIDGSGRLLADAAAIREQLLATGIPASVVVERLLTGGILVDVEEKRAVALLDWEPPAALAADGTVLGPATVADFTWADAADLVLIRGARREDADFTRRAALAGRLAAALSRRPELDRLVSEVDVSGGPYRVRVVLRSPALRILLSEQGFLEGLERVAGLLPDLVERWPRLVRVDARVPDRFLVRTEPAAVLQELPGDPEGGQTE